MARSIQVDFIIPVFRNICYTEIRINVWYLRYFGLNDQVKSKNISASIFREKND